MRNAVIRAAQVLVAAGLTLGTVALSRVPWSAEREAGAVIRLAWRYRSALVQECRRRSPEELARLPQHMRREMDCDRKLQPYRLEIIIDGDTTRDSVAARGATSDRPLSVFRETAVAAGEHHLAVRFQPYTAGGPAFALDTTLHIAPRRIVLVTIEGNRLTVPVR